VWGQARFCEASVNGKIAVLQRSTRKAKGITVNESTRNFYPRGIPVYAPNDFAARESWLRRWTLCLAGGAALVLVLAAAAGVLLFKAWSLRASPPPAAAEQKSDAGSRTQQVETHPAAAPMTPAADLTPAAKPPAAPQAPGQALLLQSVAVVTVGHLYEGHLTIGLLADGMENEVYEQSTAVQLLDGVMHSLTVVEGQLGKLVASSLDTDDRQDVEHVRRLNRLLRTQATALKEYWANPTQELWQKYDRARQAAWKGIRPLVASDPEE
jgi:hypothetical protein